MVVWAGLEVSTRVWLQVEDWVCVRYLWPFRKFLVDLRRVQVSFIYTLLQ